MADQQLGQCSEAFGEAGTSIEFQQLRYLKLNARMLEFGTGRRNEGFGTEDFPLLTFAIPHAPFGKSLVQILITMGSQPDEFSCVGPEPLYLAHRPSISSQPDKELPETFSVRFPP